MRVKPYILRLKEVLNANQPCVLIDDSGTPGQRAVSGYLHPERKTWVGVIVYPDQIAEVGEKISKKCEEVEKITGATELHFTDIYGGKKGYRKAEDGLRMELFLWMRSLFDLYQFPVIVQTLDPKTLSEIKSRAPFPSGRCGVFHFDKPSDVALFFLLFVHVKHYLLDKQAGPAYVVLDEAFQKADRSIEFTDSERDWLANCSLYSVRSSDFALLQLADFAAFTISRTQWLLVKDHRTELDNLFLTFLGDYRKNIVNLPVHFIDPSTVSATDYERLIDQDRKVKGLPSYGEEAKEP